MVTDFEKKFDDVMSYVKYRPSQNVQSEGDLRAIIESVDDNRRDKKGAPRFSDGFIQGLLSSRKARSMIQEKRSVGVFKARESYAYDGGTAIKFPRKSSKGKVYNQFRDAKTGKFVSAKRIR